MRKSVLVLSLTLAAAMAASMFIIACGGGGSSDPGLLGITADSNDDTLTFFGTANLKSISTIDAECSFPFEIIMADDGSEAYVLCYDSPAMVSIVSMDQKAVIGTVALSGDDAYDGVVAPDGYLYVAYDSSAFVSQVQVTGGMPAEMATIGISYDGGPIVVTDDGNYLYVASHQGDDNLSKIDIAAMAETDNWTPGYSYIWDLALDTDGRLYMGSYDEYEIPVFNTVNDSMMDTYLPTGVEEVANTMMLDGDQLYISNGLSYNTGYGGGALTVVDTDLTWDDYDYAQDDDSSYDVVLPFSFPFMGSNYGTITFSSNGVLGLDGYYEYDVGVQDILGFTPNNEDLDTGESYYNYSHRKYSDHVVFQWSTSVNEVETEPDSVCVLEAVVYDDGRVRYDYLFCGPDAAIEDDGYEYGIGDGSGTAVVNLRSSQGSPFDLERQSFLWDPAVSTTSMTEVLFEWEGSGALHLPLNNTPHGIAMTEDYIFLPCPKDGNYEDDEDTDPTTTSVVEVYDRATMLPAGTITVGAGPRAIAVQPAPAP